MHFIKRLFCALALLACAGCTTVNRSAMPLAEGKGLPDDGKTSVLLLKVTVKHDFKKSVNVGAYAIDIESRNEKGEPVLTRFTNDRRSVVASWTAERGSILYMRLALPPGDYVVRGLQGGGKTFPVIGSAFIPIHADLRVVRQGVYYLGHVFANTRERAETEFPAGPALPLVNQEMTGFARATFDVTIQDQSDVDIPALAEWFPALKGLRIEKLVLPPFDRNRAQKYWEANGMSCDALGSTAPAC
jgi:hypothetical protein